MAQVEAARAAAAAMVATEASAVAVLAVEKKVGLATVAVWLVVAATVKALLDATTAAMAAGGVMGAGSREGVAGWAAA